MLSLAIGLALMWLVVVIKGAPFSVKGLPSILFAGFIAWGLGSIVTGLMGIR